MLRQRQLLADSTARAGEAEGLLFDSWFDPIEDGLRAKVRGFIETMIEEELTTALSRPRYARRPAGGEAVAHVMGHRHGRRVRRLTGTFGPTEIVVPRARLVGEDGTKSEWKSAAFWSANKGSPNPGTRDCGRP